MNKWILFLLLFIIPVLAQRPQVVELTFPMVQKNLYDASSAGSVDNTIITYVDLDSAGLDSFFVLYPKTRNGSTSFTGWMQAHIYVDSVADSGAATLDSLTMYGYGLDEYYYPFRDDSTNIISNQLVVRNPVGSAGPFKFPFSYSDMHYGFKVFVQRIGVTGAGTLRVYIAWY